MVFVLAFRLAFQKVQGRARRQLLIFALPQKNWMHGELCFKQSSYHPHPVFWGRHTFNFNIKKGRPFGEHSLHSLLRPINEAYFQCLNKGEHVIWDLVQVYFVHFPHIKVYTYLIIYNYCLLLHALEGKSSRYNIQKG